MGVSADFEVLVEGAHLFFVGGGGGWGAGAELVVGGVFD